MLSAGGGEGEGGQCKHVSHYRSSLLHIFLKILLQVNKKHSKNALISIPISLLDSPVHGASFDLTYFYNLFCLGPGNYITMLRTPKILYKCSSNMAALSIVGQFQQVSHLDP